MVWRAVDQAVHVEHADGTKTGLKGGAAERANCRPSCSASAYLIGPRIACLMMAGAVLSYFVLGPAIATFGDQLNDPLRRETHDLGRAGAHRGGRRDGRAHGGEARDADPGLIRNMEPEGSRGNYLRYIGAGAVAAGGIISMFRALPLIFGSIVGGPARPARQPRAAATGAGRAVPRPSATCR